MKFLFFAAQYLPTAGGVERFCNELAGKLIARGHSVTLVTSALPGLPDKEVCPKGIHIYRLPSRLFMKGRFPWVVGSVKTRELAREIFAQPYDFSLINTRFYALSLWGARQCARRSIPAAVLEHGTKHLSLEHPLLNAAGNAYEHLMMKAVRHYCDAFYAVSKAGSRWLAHFHVQSRGEIYNAVDSQALQAQIAACGCDIRQEYDLPSVAPCISFVGRLIVEKGVWELLDAFQLVRQKVPAARLLLAGDGPLLADVQKKNVPGVLVLGQLDYGKTLSLIAQSGIFCLPTYSEGFSSTILEAAALRACIITTPTGGTPELIQNQKSGILLEDIQPATIANALVNALKNPAQSREMGEKVWQQVQARFTWDKTADTLLDIARAHHK